MARALNGLHWQSPLQSMPNGSQVQVNAGAGFGSVLILSHSDTPPAGEEMARHNIYWLEYNMRCQPASMAERVIVRLYYPMGSLPSPSDLAALWGDQLRWCQGQGVQHFQVLNEFNIEYPGQLWNPTNPSYMSALADAMRAQADPRFPIYLGFPGPGGVNNPQFNFRPGSANWNTYWSDYANVISTKYNDIALHPYAAPALGATLQSLKDDAWAQAQDVRSRFTTKPHRFTEYGINIDNYGGDTPQNRQQRATDYASFVNWVRSGWNDHILACHVYIARDSSGGHAEIYQLSDDEATTLANGVGCVGQ